MLSLRFLFVGFVLPRWSGINIRFNPLFYRKFSFDFHIVIALRETGQYVTQG